MKRVAGMQRRDFMVPTPENELPRRCKIWRATPIYYVVGSGD